MQEGKVSLTRVAYWSVRTGLTSMGTLQVSAQKITYRIADTPEL